MHTKKQKNIGSRAKSFAYATNGIWLLIRTEPNAKLHLLATIVVIVSGIIKHLGPTQWMAVTFAIGLVWVTEAINTAIEQLCDFCCKGEFHPSIKIIKDISSAAVLLSAITSVIIAVMVFFLLNSAFIMQAVLQILTFTISPNHIKPPHFIIFASP